MKKLIISTLLGSLLLVGSIQSASAIPASLLAKMAEGSVVLK